MFRFHQMMARKRALMADDNKDEESKEDNVEDVMPTQNFGRRIGDQQTTQSSSMWLVSFTDVMALMLTFFVLLFAMSNPEQEQWEDFTKNLQKNFNKFEGLQNDRGPEDAINIAKINFDRALDIRYLEALFAKLVEQEPSLNRIVIMQNADRLILSLPQDLLFESGQAQLKSNTTRTLYTIVGTLRRIKNNVEVVGHTDPRLIQSGNFSSNWELSLARASSIAGAMKDVGYTKPLTVKGHAGGRYNDLPPEISEQERMDLSRRVDIVIREDSGKRAKLFDIGLPSL